MASSIWPKANKRLVDRSLSAHSVMGLLVSAVMFIVCLSGTVAVFEDEIGWWERPTAPVLAVTPEAAQASAERVIATQPDTSHIYLYLPRDNWPRFMAGGDDGLETANTEGALTGNYETPWNDFLIHLHYYLNLPPSFGMIVVAILGVMLVAMAISGFLAHPRIFRDAFRLRRKGQARIVQADLHNRLSVWTSPFTIVVAATGAMIGLFSVIVLVLAQTSFDGNTRPLVEAVFGEEPPPDASPAGLADIGAALAAMPEVAPDADPFLVVLHDPGTAGQHVSIYGEHHDRLIYGETYNFDASGNFMGHEGASDGEAGQQIASSVYRLHFGDFGGLAVKLAYDLFGTALCIIIAAGMNIYFLKRAERGAAMPRLFSAWSALVWGTPALFTLTLLASLMGISGTWLPLLFWGGGLVIAVGGGLLADHIRVGQILRMLLWIALLANVALHAAIHAENYGNPYAWITSTIFVLFAIGLFARSLTPGCGKPRLEARAAE